MTADLHCHSRYSDGTCTPKELVDLAKEKGFKGLSITDHDTIEGFFDGYKYACDQEMILLPGVEISAQHNNESVHVLGYSFDPKNKTLDVFCAKHRERRERRNELILEKLAQAGMPLTMEEVKALSPHADAYGRPHIAVAMVQRGYVKSVLSAFLNFIGSNRPCYVAGEKWTVVQTIEAIHQAKGKAVLAHPHLLKKKELINYLLSLSFDGIEGHYSGYFHANERWCEEAEKRGWLVTGGSDFHGTIRPDVSFGASYTPEESFHQLHQHFLSHKWMG